jgi:hypothetical protein
MSCATKSFDPRPDDLSFELDGLCSSACFGL